MYRKIAFPNRRFDLHAGESDLEAASNIDITSAMAYFLRVLTVSYRKPLILKSPPHTARLAELARQFPGARFIHISRDPQQIVPSTLKLWKALDWTQGFQIPRYTDAQMIEYIHQEQAWMYDHYRQQVGNVPPEQLIEVRFEDLVNDPIAITERIYDQFGLGDFEKVSPRIQDYLVETKHVQPTRPEVDAALQQQILERWAWYLEHFRYR
jgi:hypothetical protein